MTVYLNGKFLPIAEAQVSVLDRGFIYGDGVYELVPVYCRQPYRLPQHLARLRDWSQHIVPFPVTLEFDDPARLRKFVADRLFKARERKEP